MFYRYTNRIKYVGYYTLILILINFGCKPQTGSFSLKYFEHKSNCEYFVFLVVSIWLICLKNKNSLFLITATFFVDFVKIYTVQLT